MFKSDATAEEFQSAIDAVEVVLGEAKRELAAKQLRARRAAYEWLYRAIENGKEEDLAQALAEAIRAEVPSEDLEKGENKLAELRAMTDEQRREKELHEIMIHKKKNAFLFVKRDDHTSLKELIDNLEHELRWQDWKDHMQRSLWRFAKEAKSENVQSYLAPLLGMAAPVAYKREAVKQPEPEFVSNEQAPSFSFSPELTPEVQPVTVTKASVEPSATVPEAAPTFRELTPAEEQQFRTKAFRAVVQNDSASLLQVLAEVAKEQWSVWRNKADRDLLTLSEERGSSEAYAVLAKALGLVSEAKRDTFEEREAVWIFEPGEVMPRRATVLEDTSTEVDDIYIEFWDGDEPAMRIQRCLVHKSWG